MECFDTLLMLCTDFPYRQFYPTKARIAQIDIRGENLGRRCRLDLGVIGHVREVLLRLTKRVSARFDDSHLSAARFAAGSIPGEVSTMTCSSLSRSAQIPHPLQQLIVSEDSAFVGYVITHQR